MVSGQMLGHGILLISEVVLRSVLGRVPKHQFPVSPVEPVIFIIHVPGCGAEVGSPCPVMVAHLTFGGRQKMP